MLHHLDMISYSATDRLYLHHSPASLSTPHMAPVDDNRPATFCVQTLLQCLTLFGLNWDRARKEGPKYMSNIGMGLSRQRLAFQ